MMRRSIAVISRAFLLAGIVSACSFGGGDETTVQTRTTTTGQELQDLKTAYDKGIISEREYNQQREKLLQGR
jgi:Short C-terminal domain